MKKIIKKKHSKRYLEAEKKINKNQAYSIEEAIVLMKETANTKFDSAVEIHLRTNINPQKSDQFMRGAITLPHGTGKKVRIAVFADEDEAKELKECGADIIGGTELIDQIFSTQKINFDIALTTPAFMPKVAKLAKILGPKGLMPNPKTETVTTNIKKAVGELAKGKVSYKTDDGAIIHMIIGKASFTPENLIANYKMVMDTLTKNKPEAVKGNLIKSVTICSSMGPGIKVSA